MNGLKHSNLQFISITALLHYLLILPAICESSPAIERPRGELIGGHTLIPLAGHWKFKPGRLTSVIEEIKADDIQHWNDIPVPANWYLAGYDISGEAWYAKKFTFPANYAGKRVALKFGGVDYTTEVWLNGRYVGAHEGYFQPFNFDITDGLAYGKENLLLIKVNSPLEPMVQDWSLHKQYIKGIFGHHDTRPGGAWSDRGQEMNTGGIWAPVDLEIHEIAAIESVKVTPQLNLAAKSAVAHVQMGMKLQQKSALAVRVTVKLSSYNFPSVQDYHAENTMSLSQGYNSLSIPITVNHPELWWPWDQGHPSLYQAEVRIIADNKVLDSKTITFGFRSVQFDKAKNEWRINGRRLFLRGTNYIATQWLSEMSPERFAQDIALMKSANVNIVRVHAHVTAESYYQLCDESGLLNWQDFPLQWGYKDDDGFTQNAIRQARDMIGTLYNHPSIIAWSLINEPAWEAAWMKTKYKVYNKLQNKSLTDKLYRAIQPLDGSRYVHAFSASSEHPWLGWYSGSWLDYNKPTNVNLVAEYGSQALPDIDNLRKILPEKDLWPESDQQWELWGYHNFYKKEVFKFAKISMGSSPAEFIYNTQSYQAKLIKLAAEAYRRQRYHPVSGIFQFMFCENWPSMNWGIVDYWRSPKMGYFALQQAYQPLLPSIKWDKVNFKHGEAANFELWAINDLPTAYPSAKITYSLRAGKHLLESHGLTEDITGDSGRKITSVGWTHLLPGHYELVFSIADNAGNILGVNSHEFDIGAI